MASYPTRRSKKRVSHSPFSGIAIGILAAVAGFAVTRALRRKRQLPNTKNEAQVDTPLLKHDRGFETDGGNGLPGYAESTISEACEIGNLVIDLNSGVDGNKDGPLFLKVYGVEEGHKQKIGVEVVEEQVLWKRANENEEMTAGDNKGDEELPRIDLKVKAHLNIDGASLKVLQNALPVAPEGKEGEEDRGKEQNCISVVANEDIGEGGDDDRSSAGQPPSPVLLNGNVLDFLDELDISVSASNYLSDSISECSMQEVNSAQVKPLGVAEEAMEAAWTEAKHGCVGSTYHSWELKVFAEDNDWSDKEKGSNETEMPEMEGKGCSQPEEEISDSVTELTASSVGHDDLHEEEALPLRIDRNGFLESLTDEVNVEVLPDACRVLQGKVTVKPTEGIKYSRINVRVLSDTGGPHDCNEVSTSSTSQALQVSIERDEFKKKQSGPASGISHGNVSAMADDSSNDLFLSVGCNLHNGPSLLPAHKRGFHDGIDTHYKTESQPSVGQLVTDLNAKGEADFLSSMVGDIHGLESNRGIGVIACKEDGFLSHSLDSGRLPEFGSVDDQISSNKAMGPSASSLIANLNLKPCEELTHVKSAPAAQPVLQEKAAVQPHYHDVPMVGVTHNIFVQDSSLNICNDMLVLNPGGSEDVSQEMPSLTSGSREFYNEENLNGSREEGRLSVQEEILHKMSSLRSDTMKGSQHEEKPVIQADVDDGSHGSQGRANETAGCESVGENLSEEKIKFSTDDQIINSEISHITESTQELLCLKDCSMEVLKNEEPGTLSDGFDIASAADENMMGIDSEQPIFPLVSSLGSRRKDFGIVNSADNLEHSFGLTIGRKDGKQAEFDDMDKGSWRKQRQEIEEMISAKDASNKLKDFAHSMHSQHSSRSADREIEEVYAQGAVSSQRGTFSTKLLMPAMKANVHCVSNLLLTKNGLSLQVKLLIL